jgi:hypothetical protein
MYCIDIVIVVTSSKFRIFKVISYSSHNQLYTILFRILINSVCEFYITEYEHITIYYNYSN